MRHYTGKFTRVSTAATVALFVVACASAPATTDVAADIRVELVEWGRLAQNAHNIQPWRVVLDPVDAYRFDLYIEDERLLPETDPPARQITLSAGTFLAVVEARAAQIGYQADIDLFPRGEYTLATIGELPVAYVTLQKTNTASARYPVAAAPDAISSPTIKFRYEPATLERSDIETFTGYGDEQLRVAVITEPAEVVWLNELSMEAFELEMQHEPTLMESYNLTRKTGRQRRQDPYGIAYTGNFTRGMLRLVDFGSALFPMAPDAYAEAGIDSFERSIGQINSYVVLATRGNSRTSQVEAGMALQAIWMAIRESGHITLATSQALQEYPAMAGLYEEIYGRLAEEGETLQMVLAVATAQRGRHRFGIRFPTEAFITGMPAE